jgi:prepilin-type N-terminal cleavage/methylation domain-containing protein
MKSRTVRNEGFSLIELMVAVAVLGVVTAQLFIVFSNQKRVYMSNERVLDVQEQARLTLDLISFDTRMAGFMVTRWAAVSSVDGGTTDADRLCVSDASYFDFTGTPSPLDSRTRPFEGATVTNLQAASITVTTLDIDGNGVDDFRQGSGVIIATPTETFCARITNNVNAGGTLIEFVDHGEATTFITGGVSANLRAVPAQIYELDEDALELRRNGLLLASSIEDLQVEYWLDTSGTPDGIQDGENEFPVNDLAAPDPPGGAIPADNSMVRRVRVSVLARTDREEERAAASGLLTEVRPAMANRIAGTENDRFRRRSYSASILPRNLVAVGDT